MPKSPLILTEEFKEILNILEHTRDSIFITGKAGTGKSSLLKLFLKRTQKRYALLAPTGIAALNVGGQTIHSFFRFPPDIIDPDAISADRKQNEMLRKLEMLIIDEVSMVRADLMHGIDQALRKNRDRPDYPFGGVQLVLVGDLFQLPPVVRKEDLAVLLQRYEGYYFFDAPVFQHFHYYVKELSRVFRQSEDDIAFKRLLNHIRLDQASPEDLELLNSRHEKRVGKPEEAIYLSTRRNIARNINRVKLEMLEGQEHIYLGHLSGKYTQFKDKSEEVLENKLPAPYRLRLKPGAQIMMLKNDSGKRWVNGTLGKIEKLEDEKIIVKIKGNTYSLEKETWEEVRHVFNPKTGQLEKKSLASFTQYPINLAYAVTIHKSQGKTFDKIIVDVGKGAFAPGQVYVALSRCTSLEGIVLSTPIRSQDILIDPRVVEFYKSKSTL